MGEGHDGLFFRIQIYQIILQANYFPKVIDSSMAAK